MGKVGACGACVVWSGYGPNGRVDEHRSERQCRNGADLHRILLDLADKAEVEMSTDGNAVRYVYVGADWPERIITTLPAKAEDA